MRKRAGRREYKEKDTEDGGRMVKKTMEKNEIMSSTIYMNISVHKKNPIKIGEGKN
jgi:hypothetical protein